MRTDSPRRPRRTLRLFAETGYDAADALAENRHVEVENESDAVAGQLQVGKQLRCVYRGQLFNGFEFNNNGVLYKQIDLLSTLKLDTVVHDGHALFRLDLKAPPNQLEA